MRKILLVIDDFNDLLALEAFFRRIGFDVLSLGKDILVNDAMLGFVPDFVIATAKGRTVDGAKLAIRLKNQSSKPVVALIYPSGQPPVLSVDAEAAVDAVIEIPFQPRSLLSIVADLTKIDKHGLLEKYERLRAAKLQGFDDQNLFQNEGGTKSGIKIVRSGNGIVDEVPADLADAIQLMASPPTSESFKGAPAADRNESTRPRREKIKPSPASNSASTGSKPVEKEVKSARLNRYEKFLQENDDDVSRVMSRSDAIAARDKLLSASASEKEQLDRIDAEKRAFVKTLFENQSGSEKTKLGSRSDPSKK